jgi:hypothetical protein
MHIGGARYLASSRPAIAQTPPFDMAGLDPVIHLFLRAAKTWMPGAWASEATPFFERLWPGMTNVRPGFQSFNLGHDHSMNHGVVVRVRADPKPNEVAVGFGRECSVAQAHPYRPESADFLELQ